MDKVLTCAVSVVVMDGHMRSVYGQLFEVWPSMTIQLSVQVWVNSTLEQWIVWEVNSANDMTWLELIWISMGKLYEKVDQCFTKRTYHDLFRFSKIVRRISVELHNSKQCDWDQLLGKYLCRIQQVKTISQHILFIHDLHPKFPLGTISRSNRIPKVASVEISVLAGQYLCFLPDQTGFSLLSFPVPFDELWLSGLSHKSESVNAETIHVAVGAWNTISGHCPEEGVERTRLLAEEIPCRVMGSSSLRDLFVWTWLDSMDKIWEQDGVLDEENWNVISNDIWNR